MAVVAKNKYVAVPFTSLHRRISIRNYGNTTMMPTCCSAMLRIDPANTLAVEAFARIVARVDETPR